MIHLHVAGEKGLTMSCGARSKYLSITKLSTVCISPAINNLDVFVFCTRGLSLGILIYQEVHSLEFEILSLHRNEFELK